MKHEVRYDVTILESNVISWNLINQVHFQNEFEKTCIRMIVKHEWFYFSLNHNLLL